MRSNEYIVEEIGMKFRRYGPLEIKSILKEYNIGSRNYKQTIGVAKKKYGVEFHKRGTKFLSDKTIASLRVKKPLSFYQNAVDTYIQEAQDDMLQYYEQNVRAVVAERENPTLE